MLVGEEMGKCTSGALPIAQAGGGVGQIPAGSVVGAGHDCDDGVNRERSYVSDQTASIYMSWYSRVILSASAD